MSKKKRNSRHHIVPVSRLEGQNIVNINKGLHNKYHALFSNRTPYEILEFLVDYFWGGDMTAILQFMEERYYE